MKAIILALWGIAATAQLRVDSPREYQVFQRDSKESGPVHIRGDAGPGCGSAEYRIDADDWKILPGCAFDVTMRVDAGGWYALEFRTANSGSAKVDHFGVGEVFVIAGQSNSTNFGEARRQTATQMVVSFSGTDWALANDPLAGPPDKSTGGSFAAPFGDAMFARYHVPIAVASTGYGGTSVRQWLPRGERFTVPVTSPLFVKAVGPREWESDGTLFEGLMARIVALGPHGIRAVLWHQGESDSFRQAGQQTSMEQYRSAMEKIIRACRTRAGWEIPWFVAQVSYNAPDRASFAPVRDAQAELWASGLAIAGPDTDTLTGDMRQNQGRGVHLSAAGLDAHGRMWADKVSVWLDRQ